MSSNDYINREVQKILSSDKDYSLKSALAISWIMAHFKGTNLKIFNTQNINPLADYFILGSVQNKIQAQSVAQTIQRTFKDKNLPLKSIEGVDEGEWILIDLGDVIVHLFNEMSREIFNLDSLWKTYPQVEVPNEFYYSAHDNQQSTSSDPLKNYF